MTDGPHKSLPMNRAWKRVAKKLANPNSTLSEICDLVQDALLTAERRHFISRLRSIVAPGSQGNLLLGDSTSVLAGLKELNQDAASTFARNAVDYCAVKFMSETESFKVLDGAIAYALRQETESHFRGIAEHWLREAPGSATSMRRRCAETDAAMNYGQVSDLASSTSRGARSPVRRQTGLNEGVAL